MMRRTTGGLAELLQATGFFNAQEVDVALELVDDRLARGPASHYRFLVLEEEKAVLGYACWGVIPGTRASADLYWIAVHPGHQRQGLGRTLLEAAESWMAQEGPRPGHVGTGALRRGLAEFLSSHPLVERIHAEAEDRGGNAVTVAELQS